MAVTQKLVLRNTTGTQYASFEEAMDAVSEIAVPEYTARIHSYASDNKLVLNTDFDATTQTITLTREWDDAAYAEWKVLSETNRNINKSALEAAGWEVSGDDPSQT